MRLNRSLRKYGEACERDEGQVQIEQQMIMVP